MSSTRCPIFNAPGSKLFKGLYSATARWVKAEAGNSWLSRCRDSFRSYGAQGHLIGQLKIQHAK